MKQQSKFIKQGVVARHTEGLRRYFGWPTVCCDENGVLYAIVSRRMLHIDPFGQVCLYRSTDNGETWSDAQVIVDDDFDDRDSGIYYLGNGKMIMSYFTHSLNAYLPGGGYYNYWVKRTGGYCSEEQRDEVIARMSAHPQEERYGGSYLRLSEDYGKTWGEKIHVPVSAPHGPTLLNDGRLIYIGHTHCLADYKRVTGDETEYPTDYMRICTIISDDGGKTWQKHSVLPMPMDWHGFGGPCNACEPHILQRKNGTLIAVIRYCNDSEAARGGEYTFTYLSYSTNGGARWTVPVPLRNVDGDIVIGSPAHLCELQDGAIVLSYSRRASPCGIRAVISYDGGYTWGEEVILGQNWNPEDGDLGYPATTQLPNGELLTVAYRKYFDDPLPCLMYTRWRQKDRI